MFNYIIDFIQDKLNDHQFGFLKNVVHVLLISYSNIVQSMENEVPTDVVYLDLSKAFDTV